MKISIPKKKIMSVIMASSLVAAVGMTALAAANTSDYVQYSVGNIEYDADGNGTPEVKFSADDMQLLEATVITSEREIEVIEEEIGDDPDTPIKDKLDDINSKLNTVVYRSETAESDPERTIEQNTNLLYNGFKSGTVEGDVSSLPANTLEYLIPAGLYDGSADVSFDLTANNEYYEQKGKEDGRANTVANARIVKHYHEHVGDPSVSGGCYGPEKVGGERCTYKKPSGTKYKYEFDSPSYDNNGDPIMWHRYTGYAEHTNPNCPHYGEIYEFSFSVMVGSGETPDDQYNRAFPSSHTTPNGTDYKLTCGKTTSTVESITLEFD